MEKRFIGLKYYFLRDINAVIRFLIISDTVMTGAMGLLGPIFALFIGDFIIGGNAAVAGIAAGIYLFTKSVFQVPIAVLIDKIRGEKDDFYLLLFSSFLVSTVPLLYLAIDTPLELYIVQFILGLLTAFTFPTYMAIFTRHIDREREGTEWGVYFTLTDLASAALAVVGGYVATVEGFPMLIITVAIISTMGAFLLWPIKPYIRLALADQK